MWNRTTSESQGGRPGSSGFTGEVNVRGGLTGARCDGQSRQGERKHTGWGSLL
jgi:hypothetical protein